MRWPHTLLLVLVGVWGGCRKQREPRVPVLPEKRAQWTQLAPGASFWKGGSKGEDGDLTWSVIRLELDKVDLRIARAAGENIHSSSRDDEVLFAVNGGFFDVRPSGRYFATGLLVSKGKELSPLSPHLSGILVVSEGRAQLLSPSDALPKWSQVDMAVQCRPRLLEPGGALGVHSDDKARAPRTAACIRDGGKTLDFVLVWGRRNPEAGPGLYAVSQALKAFGCDSALNLDGGASTGMYLKGRPSADHFARGPVPWVIEGRRAPPQSQ